MAALASVASCSCSAHSGFPQPLPGWLEREWARREAESGAISLINGVRDDRDVKMLGHVERIYRVAGQLRVRRLDMFADGLQDWIGLEEANLFGGRRRPEELKGRCFVVALVQWDNGAPAARVSAMRRTRSSRSGNAGNCRSHRSSSRSGRSSPTNRFINRAFYLDKLNTTQFLGYIRDYNPQLRYAVRSADNGILSEEKIPVRGRDN